MKHSNISILGCGWLGLPLGVMLHKNGFVVKGSTISSENDVLLLQNNIQPFQLKLTDTVIIADQLPEFLNSEILIICFPPERREDIESYHLAQFNLLLPELKKSTIKKVLFISSTSVYPDLNKEVFEHETALPLKPSGKALKRVEELLVSHSYFTTTIIRFSGLIGYDRLPDRSLAGKKIVENGDVPMNVIHRDDCIALILEIIQQQKWGELFNASADQHPTRKEFYSLAAKKNGLKKPEFKLEKEINFKIINSDKIKEELGYSFKYPNPLDLVK
jgi:nucleoside-diphosphate-sugar epimerase